MGNRSNFIRAAALVLALLLPGPLVFAEEAAKPSAADIASAVKDALGASFYVQGGYTYNLNGQTDNNLRVFDQDANSFLLDLAQLSFSRTAERGGVGYLIKLSAGETAKKIHSTGLGSADDPFDLTDAYITYLAPVGEGLELTFGKFETFHGAEVIPAAGNWNYSRSLLFNFAIPFTHVGFKAMYPVTDYLKLGFHLVNGWDNLNDNNKDKSFGYSAVVTPLEGLCVALNFMHGPEKDENNHDMRYLADVVATYQTPLAGLSLMANYDYGYEENNGESPSVWQGVAGYARYQATEMLAAAVRGEWFDDRTGLRTGTAQTLYEVTFTPEIKIAGNLLIRPEYRHDWSDEEVFVDSDGNPKKSQDTVAVGLMYTW